MILMFGSGAGPDEGSKAIACASDLRQKSRERKWAVPKAKGIQHLAEDMTLFQDSHQEVPTHTKVPMRKTVRFAKPRECQV